MVVCRDFGLGEDFGKVFFCFQNLLVSVGRDGEDEAIGGVDVAGLGGLVEAF